MKSLMTGLSALALLAACGNGAEETPTGVDEDRETTLGSDTSADRPDFEPGTTREADDQVDFTAIGQEPGWLLELTAGRDVVIEWDYATKTATFPFERTDNMEGPLDLSLSTDSDTLALNVVEEDCTDPMNGAEYVYSVTATINGETLQGCGEWLTE